MRIIPCSNNQAFCAPHMFHDLWETITSYGFSCVYLNFNWIDILLGIEAPFETDILF